jgi:hypothetical protein
MDPHALLSLAAELPARLQAATAPGLGAGMAALWLWLLARGVLGLRRVLAQQRAAALAEARWRRVSQGWPI